MALKSVTIKLDPDLHQALSDYTQLTRIKMQDLIGRALEKELETRLVEGGEKLREMLESMREYRKERAA